MVSKSNKTILQIPRPYLINKTYSTLNRNSTVVYVCVIELLKKQIVLYTNNHNTIVFFPSKWRCGCHFVVAK